MVSVKWLEELGEG